MPGPFTMNWPVWPTGTSWPASSTIRRDSSGTGMPIEPDPIISSAYGSGMPATRLPSVMP